MNAIDPIHSPCKNCVFSVYDNNTQTDCSLNYLEKYKTIGAEILEAYDDDKEFFIVNSKKCIGYRENKWFKQFGLENSELSDKINKYYELNHLDYLAVVDLKSFTVHDLQDLLTEFNEANIKPQKIIFIRYVDDQQIFSYDVMQKLIADSKIDFPWRIQTIVDTDLINADIIHNITSINTKYRFTLSIIDPGSGIADLIDKTNKLVHEDLDQFLVVTNSNRNAIIFSGAVYRFGLANQQYIFSHPESYKVL